MSFSLSPSLSAPSVSPAPNAVVLPVLSRPSVSFAVQSPSPLSVSVTPAASKASELRAEAANALPDSHSSRPVGTPLQAAAPAAAASSENLDSLFDGSFPTSREVLSRASSLALPHSVLARTLSDSQSPSDAAARLSSLGVLSSQEAAFAASREDEFRFLLTRVWRKTSSSIPSAFPVDESLPVAALKVTRSGITYFVHGVAHGQLGAPRRSAVLATVRRITSSGESLYSEQNLPAHYGYTAGLETLDHASSLPEIVPAAPGFSAASLRLKRAVDWAVAPGAFLAVAAWLVLSPASPFAWLLLPLAGLLAWFVLTGGLPVMAWKRVRLAARMRAQGLEDIADQYADEAAHFFKAKPDLELLRGLELPQPLGASSDRLSARSRSIADAVAASAAAAGATAVHLVVGHLHAHEVAARLASGPRAPVPGSQIS